MNNFWNALKLCLADRWRLAAAAACTLTIAFLWGANIGTVYPFIEVVFRGRSLHEWIDEEIATCQQTIADSEARLAELGADGPGETPADAQAEAAAIGARLLAERSALDLRQRVRPWILRWLPSDPYRTLMVVIAMLLLGTIVKDSLLVANTVLVESIVQGAMTGVRREFFEHGLRLDVGSLGQNNSGEMTSRFTYDLTTLGNSLRSLMGKAVLEPLKMLACLIGAGIVCWRLLLFSLLLAPPAIFVIQKLGQSIKRANRRAMEEMSRLVGQLGESLDAVQTVKAYTMEAHECERFKDRAQAFYRKSLQIAWYGALTKPATEMLGIGVISIALLAGAYLVLQQETHVLGIRICDRPISLPALLMFYAMLAGVTDPARKLSDIYSVLQPGMPAADRIYELLHTKPAVQDPPAPQHVARPHRKLTFDN
ncbi:MAG: hypothetical protein KDA41_04600, partial [Planctomycetales bacterium]|nr:hypothetical protein [Planctomycetales bacterium]